MSKPYKIDVIIDGKRVTSEGEKIKLKVDGVEVFSTINSKKMKRLDIKNLPWISIKSFLKASDSAFSHVNRFHIVKSLSSSPKSFTEIKELLDTTSANANFHLKTLIDGAIAYKDETGRYALTLLGELLLEHFSRFLFEANNLQESLIE